MYTWPDQLTLPEPIKAALLKHLTEPFQSETAAKAYWLSNGTTLVVSAPPEDVISEYIEPLPDNYTISLVITSDAGEGIYYLTPPTQES